MPNHELLSALLDSLPEPLLFADAEHTIRYMNRAAREHYEEGAQLLGRSLLACHNEASCGAIRETLAGLSAGEEERLISDEEKLRIFMRAVRDPHGRLLGYYERYERPWNGR